MRGIGDETLVKVRIGEKSNGRAVHETVWVEVLPNGTVRLKRAPVMALGLAVGDEFRVDHETRLYEVVRRAGNVTVQLASSGGLGEAELDDVRTLATEVGGTFDAHTTHVAALTIPASVGFAPIEEALAGFVTSRPETTWWYGNVYDDEGKPLNWW